MARILLTAFVCFAGVSLALAADWSYDMNAADGTDNWGGLCSTGTKQTPIDINTTEAMYDSSLSSFSLVNYGNSPSSVNFTTENKGYTLQVSFDENVYNVSGGGLTGTYTTVQFHLHWGSTNSRGSEHTVNKEMFAAELHFVSYNTKYPDIVSSLAHSDGLAVLGVFLKKGSSNNTNYAKFLDHISSVMNSGQKLTISAFPLRNLLPNDIRKYYRYNGSLTTPDCNEAVTWTVFKEPVEISQNQLDALRSLKMNATMNIVNNFRRVQPLGNRTVKASYDHRSTTPMSTGSTTPADVIDRGALKKSSVALLLMLLGAVFFL